jgi:putative PEP-CTERM system histidine kinase
MHDIKNLSSQLALLARNAERHAENPAFRADMLVTLRNSSDKLNHLVARLSRYGSSTVDKVEPVEVGELAQQLAETFRVRHNVEVIERDECTIAGQRHSIEQILTHLIQNAVDASAPEMPVFVSITGDGLFCRIEIVDSGHGMAPEFVRNRLFKPFDSSKPGGFGIGAYEARELVRAMHGRLDVESREGIGTRFIIRLPLASAAEILKTLDNETKVA